MHIDNWPIYLRWAIAAFFLIGSVIHFAARPGIVEEYRRWRYPERFYYVTGALELGVAMLLLWPSSQVPGYLLGAAIMAAAIGTLLIRHENRHAIAPAIVLSLIALCAWGSTPSRSSAQIPSREPPAGETDRVTHRKNERPRPMGDAAGE